MEPHLCRGVKRPCATGQNHARAQSLALCGGSCIVGALPGAPPVTEIEKVADYLFGMQLA